MWFVYILKSTQHSFIYVGSSQNVEKRVLSHNMGENQSTKHYAPFTLEAYIALRTEKKAIELEKYFKTGSGKSVLKKRFLE